MPLAWLGLFVSVVALASSALNHTVHGDSPLEVLLAGGGLLALVILFFAFCVCRGHYSDELNEP